jgi:hypothetical protein
MRGESYTRYFWSPNSDAATRPFQGPFHPRLFGRVKALEPLLVMPASSAEHLLGMIYLIGTHILPQDYSLIKIHLPAAQNQTDVPNI